jgi:hypothetical protein
VPSIPQIHPASHLVNSKRRTGILGDSKKKQKNGSLAIGINLMRKTLLDKEKMHNFRDRRAFPTG